jgi:hypothetical protein
VKLIGIAKPAHSGKPKGENLPRHATPTIKRMIQSLFQCKPGKGFSVGSILEWVNEGKLPGENLVSRDTMRKELMRMKQEGIIGRTGLKNLPIYIWRGKLPQDQTNVAWRGNKGDPIGTPSNHATPNPLPSDRHGIRCYGSVDPLLIESIKAKLPYTNLSRFFVPRFVPPLEKDKAHQWKFEGESVKVMISEGGRCQVYPQLIGWETELEKWFPVQAEEIKNDPRTRSHKGFDREAWGRYHQAKYGEFKIQCGKGTTISGDHSPPGPSIELMGNESNIKAMEADSFGLDEATRLALTFQIREEQRRIASRLEDLSSLVLSLSKAIIPKQEIPKGENEPGGMFR